MKASPRHASRARRETELGARVARLLRHAWRASVQSPTSNVQKRDGRRATDDRGSSPTVREGFDTLNADHALPNGWATAPNHALPNGWATAPDHALPDGRGSAWFGGVQSSNAELQTSNSELRTLSEAELTEITPLLCRSGSGALAWWQIRNTPLAATAAGEQLHEVYRRFRLSALIHEREIAYVFSLLRDAGIEAVLVKGWAIARCYPDLALRPYGDIDICVAPDQLDKAQHALRCLENLEGHYVDLHAGFSRIGQGAAANGKNVGADLRVRPRFAQLQKRAHTQVRPYDSREWDEVFARSIVVECGGQPVRIPCDEDHLRLLSMHLLRSGAWRPAWLCDIALLLKPAFDWDICLGRNQVHTNWVRTTMALAHELLGANENDVQGPTSNVQSPELPRWLVPAVLKQWGRTKQWAVGSGQWAGRPFGTDRLWTLDIGHWTSLYSRWDNPIRATAAVGGEFNNWPRLPYRLAESLMRLPELGKRRRRTEVGGRRSEVRGQRSEGGTQRAEGERQRAESSSQRTVNRPSDLRPLTSDLWPLTSGSP